MKWAGKLVGSLTKTPEKTAGVATKMKESFLEGLHEARGTEPSVTVIDKPLEWAPFDDDDLPR